jgi:hypothetical protein
MPIVIVKPLSLPNVFVRSHAPRIRSRSQPRQALRRIFDGSRSDSRCTCSAFDDESVSGGKRKVLSGFLMDVLPLSYPARNVVRRRFAWDSPTLLCGNARHRVSNSSSGLTASLTSWLEVFFQCSVGLERVVSCARTARKDIKGMTEADGWVTPTSRVA